MHHDLASVQHLVSNICSGAFHLSVCAGGLKNKWLMLLKGELTVNMCLLKKGSINGCVDFNDFGKVH